METSARLTGWRLLTNEFGLVLVAVTLFVGFLYGTLHFYFPAGVGLSTDLMSGLSAAQELSTPRVGALAGGRLQLGALIERDRDVQRRSADALNWQRAGVGDLFLERDSLQTGDNSTAVVRSEDGGHLTVLEKSLIVFERGAAGLAGEFARPIAVMMQGELGAEVQVSGAESVEVARVNGGAVEVQAGEQGGPAKFSVVVNSNRTATVNLYSGAATYRTARESIALAERHALTVDANGHQLALVELPPPPQLLTPAANAKFQYRNAPELVRFSWAPVPKTDGYRLRIARDARFRDIVVDEVLTEPQFRHGNLTIGHYFWKVRSRLGWAQGLDTAAADFDVSRVTTPPALRLDATPRVVSERFVTISGTTDPDARVFVRGKPAEMSGNMFHRVTELDAGANVITVESVDAVGNVAYASVVVVSK
ncbi:MAG: hypothetical protein WCE48_04275 [Steroidobacteraceae bacterium]